MPFEFAFLDWLYQFRNPVMNTISIFFDYAGAHGEIWIAFTLLLLLFRRTRKAGFAMAVALVLYMAAGHFFLKPLFARPRPCDLNTSITMLVARPHGHSFPSGHTASGVAAAYALWLQNRKLGAPALVLAAFIAFTRLYLYVHFPTDVLGGAVLGIALGAAASAFANYMANRKKKTTNCIRKGRCTHFVQRPFCSIIPPGAGISGSVPGPSTPAPADCPQAGRRPALPPASSA